MLCRLDFSGRFSRLSPAWERTLGFSRDELMSRRFIEFVHPDDRERTLRQNAVVRRGGQALAFENRYRCKDGSYRWLAWNAAPDDRECVIYSVAVDITLLKELETACEVPGQGLDELLSEMKTAGPLLTVCAWCLKLRGDDDPAWSLAHYKALHPKIRVSHGLCPRCLESVIKPQIARL
jgi:PAS domain S-box-containing protein